VCFAKHTLNKHNLGRLGLKPRFGPLSFLFFFFSFLFFFAGSNPTNMGWAGLGWTQPGHWLGASDPAGEQARMAQPTCALHSVKVLKLPSHCFLATIK